MNNSHMPSENPFESSQVVGTPQSLPNTPRRVHPLMIVVLVLISIVIGGCTFFCTCLGAFMLTDVGDWLLVVCGLLSVLATIGFFRLVFNRLRRPRKIAITSDVDSNEL